jgi:hypothetical protein
MLPVATTSPVRARPTATTHPDLEAGAAMHRIDAGPSAVPERPLSASRAACIDLLADGELLVIAILQSACDS